MSDFAEKTDYDSEAEGAREQLGSEVIDVGPDESQEAFERGVAEAAGLDPEDIHAPHPIDGPDYGDEPSFHDYGDNDEGVTRDYGDAGELEDEEGDQIGTEPVPIDEDPRPKTTCASCKEVFLNHLGHICNEQDVPEGKEALVYDPIEVAPKNKGVTDEEFAEAMAAQEEGPSEIEMGNALMRIAASLESIADSLGAIEDLAARASDD